MKILVIFTGGTIGSAVQDGVIAPGNEQNCLLLEMYGARGKRKVDFLALPLFSLLSENLDGGFLRRLAKQVKEASERGYDGIIVTHGSDTLQYSAAALGYVLGLSCIPVILVCSNYVLTDKRANGLENFTAAVDFIAERRGCGVFVSYANVLGKVVVHRASRLLAHEACEHALYSIKDLWYGVYEEGEYRKNERYREFDDALSPLPAFDSVQDGSVSFAFVYPGMSYPRLTEATKAVLLQGYHSGTLPTGVSYFQDFARQAQARKIPVFLCGSSVGRVQSCDVREVPPAENGNVCDRAAHYASEALLESLNIEVLPCGAPIAMYMKLWLLAEKDENLKGKMRESLGGDLVPEQGAESF